MRTRSLGPLSADALVPSIEAGGTSAGSGWPPALAIRRTAAIAATASASPPPRGCTGPLATEGRTPAPDTPKPNGVTTTIGPRTPAPSSLLTNSAYRWGRRSIDGSSVRSPARATSATLTG